MARVDSRFTARHCYRFSLVVILGLIAAALLGALYDILQQMVHDRARPTKAGDISIAASTYVVVGVFAFFISLSRWLSTRRAMLSIPKPYIPIEKSDLPKSTQRVYEMISTEYSRAALVMYVSQPKGRQLPGWGVAGTPYEGMCFRTAILQTVDTLKSMLGPISSVDDKEAKRKAFSPRSSLLGPYLATLFDPPEPVLRPQHRPIIQLWDSHLEKARWSLEEPTQSDFEEVLRILAIVLAELGRKSADAAAVEKNASPVEARLMMAVANGKRKMHWVALESNPDLFNVYTQHLGLDTSKAAFTDVFGFEHDLLAMVPQPVLATVLLFPPADALLKKREDIALPKAKFPDVTYIRQTVGNACGTMGLLHAIGNSGAPLVPDSTLAKLYARCKGRSPEECAELLESDTALEEAHGVAAAGGQTAAPGATDSVPLHFSAFVEHKGHLIELDGGMIGPIDHGPIEADCLKDSARVTQEYMKLAPGSYEFSLVALSATGDVA